jgi:hypothetical protein
MKPWTRTNITVAGLALSLLGVTVAAQASSSASSMLPTAATSTTSRAAQTLLFGREEERMARDLYRAFAAKYPTAITFSHIAMSEQRHLDAMNALLASAGVPEPAATLTAGKYADPTIQALYDTWLAQGSASVDAAYQVGVALEKQDISDLEKAIAGDLPAATDRVLGNLLRASRQHLVAYTAAASGDAPGAGDGTCGAGMANRPSEGPGSGGAGGMGNRRGMGNAWGDDTGTWAPGQGMRGSGRGNATS